MDMHAKASMGLFQSFREARSQHRFQDVFRKERFGSDPSELSHQWHLWTDGNEVVSVVRRSSSDWVPGPEVEVGDLSNEGSLEKYAQSILLQSPKGHSRGMLGIFVHRADEFTLVSLRKNVESPDHYLSGAYRILDDPQSIVEERVSSDFSYRYFPLPGARSAVAIKLSLQAKVESTRPAELRSPFRFALLSGVWEFLACLGFLLPVEEETDGRGRVLVLVYPKFTVLATIGAEEGLLAVATLLHTGMGSPADVGFRVAGCLRQASLDHATIWIVQASESAPWKQVRQEIDQYLASDSRFAETVRVMELSIAFLVRSACEQCGIEEGKIRPEMLLSFFPLHERKVFESAPVAENMRLSAMQNFSSKDLRLSEKRLTYKEACWLSIAKVFHGMCAVFLVSGLALLVVGIWKGVRSEAWSLDPVAYEASRQKATDLDALATSYRLASDLTKSRSQAWSVMELAARLFPEGCGVYLESLSYELHPPSGPVKSEGNKRSGFVRDWKISGMADAQGIQFLDQFGKDYVIKEFAYLGELPEAQIFSSAIREPMVWVDRQPRAPMEMEGQKFETRFVVTITQNIPENDEFAFLGRALSLPPLSISASYLP